MAEMRNINKLFIGGHKGQRSLEIPRYRWDNNIEMNITEIVWECVDWIHLARDRDKCLDLVNDYAPFKVTVH
jgi:hypothetical protein